MSWLRAGVPVTLIADLAARGGPLSKEILTAEAVDPDVIGGPSPRAGGSVGAGHARFLGRRGLLIISPGTRAASSTGRAADS